MAAPQTSILQYTYKQPPSYHHSKLSLLCETSSSLGLHPWSNPSFTRSRMTLHRSRHDFDNSFHPSKALTSRGCYFRALSCMARENFSNHTSHFRQLLYFLKYLGDEVSNIWALDFYMAACYPNFSPMKRPGFASFIQHIDWTSLRNFTLWLLVGNFDTTQCEKIKGSISRRVLTANGKA